MTSTPQTLDWSDIPFSVHVDYVPASHTDQRPGIPQVPLWINVHETANTNYGADALMHRNWLHNYVPGVASKQTSVHLFVDDNKCYQTLPFNEVSWNAGCGACEGNYAAVSLEICVNRDGNYAQTLENTARIVAKLAKDLSIPLSRIVIHKYWSGKWCPAIMLNQGKWAYFFEMVTAFYNAMSAPVPQPAPSIYGPAQPVILPDGTKWDGTTDVEINGVIFHGDVRRVTIMEGGAECRQWAAFDSLFTRGPVAADTQVSVLGWVNGESRAGEQRWWITKAGTRIWVGDTDESPSLVFPADPADNIDLPGVPPSPKVVDGIRYYFLGPDGEGRDITISASKTNVRKKPSRSTVTRVVEKGAVLHATHWVYGDEINGESVYWRLDTGEFVWSGATIQRPM